MTMTGHIGWWGATDSGRSRHHNEDAWSVEDSLSAAVLSDGMGGAACGEVASAETIAGVLDYLRRPEPALAGEELAKEAIRAANRRVIQASSGRPACRGMGSTVVLAIWNPPDVVIANVGDSRAYLWRAGEMRQLSYDQSLANELRTSLGFSEERVRAMPNANVLTMAVGAYEHVLIRTRVERLEPGDHILLCSDGLHGPVDHRTIATLVGERSTLRDRVEKLIDSANQNGGPDNVTAVLLEFKGNNDG